MTRHDRLATPELFVLTALALLTRFWNVVRPRAVVFDEAHYERFAGHYLIHSFYYDVHPPLANLLYAAEARLFGIGAATLLGPEPAPVLRLLPALFGAALVPLVYVIVRELGERRAVAALAAFVVLFDNALATDARFVLLESLIMGFALAAIALFLRARRRAGPRRWWLLGLSGLAAGCALSVKWTGASALGIILTAWFVDLLLDRESRTRLGKRVLGEGALLVGMATMVYVVVFAIHFRLLSRAGADDTAMPLAFRATLVGDAYYDPRATASLWTRMRVVHHAMNAANYSFEGVTHPAASPWYTWPIMKHPIVLWSDGRTPPATIILLGNPVVWWGSIVVVLLAGVIILRRAERSPSDRYALTFLSGAFALNYVPFMAITRVMYLYHYLFALLWLSVLAVVALGAVAGWNAANDGDRSAWQFPSGRPARLYWSVAGLVLAGFLFFAPFTYGWHLRQTMYDARFWVLHPHL